MKQRIGVKKVEKRCNSELVNRKEINFVKVVHMFRGN